MSLRLAICEALGEIQRELFRGPAPHHLHHYTKATVVESIVRTRSLWATCIADQSDQTEISHTSKMVEQFAGDVSMPNASIFQCDVLRRLPFFMEERKQWIFIACFCDDEDSALHWDLFGNYRLTFPTPWTNTPSLALPDSQAECWYQRVIYDERLQQNAVERALRTIMDAISKNTNGQNEGPWAKDMVDNCARNIAQLLLGLAVGFKGKKFSKEKEWRIVCAPRLGTNSSAPKWIDEYFGVNIKSSPRRHVLLQINQLNELFQRPSVPPVPLLDWSRNPDCRNSQEVDGINDTLKTNNREDLARFD